MVMNQLAIDAVSAAARVVILEDYLAAKLTAQFTKDVLEHIQECPVCTAHIGQICTKTLKDVRITRTNGTIVMVKYD